MYRRPDRIEACDRRPAFLRRAELCVLATTLFIALAASAGTFSAALDRDTVVVGETVTLTLTFDGASPGGMPQLPAIPGLQVTGAMSSGYSSSLGADRQMHSVKTYSVPLRTTQPGQFQIPALQIDLAGQKLSSEPLSLKVLREDSSAPPVEQATKSAFLWLALPKKEAYVGESVVGELRLYLRQDVGDISNFQIPAVTGEGYNASKPIQGQQFNRRVGNSSFTVIPLLFTLIPVKSGLLNLELTGGSVVIHGGARDFFGNYRQQAQVALSLERQTFQALPLPTNNVPADFNGAIGNFTLTASVGPTNVATGDPITLRVEISGRGSLDGLTLSQPGAWRNFKTYPPTSNLKTTDKFGLQGTKTFEQIVSPESTDVKELPTFSFSFFDPDARQYRSLTQPAVALVVRPSAATPAPSVAVPAKTSGDAPPPAQDIVHIKPRVGALAVTGPPLIRQRWFLALQGVPVFAWLVAVGWRRRADALANNPRLRRQRQVAQVIRAGLEELRRHAAANRAEAFFVTLFRLLQEQLGERLDSPAAAITEAVIEEKLRPRGVAETTRHELHELFQACNLARYAPSRSGQELIAMVPRFESVIRDLRNLKA